MSGAAFWVAGRPSKAAEFLARLDDRLGGKTLAEVRRWVLLTMRRVA